MSKFRHISSDCVNQKVITLVEWTSMKEEKIYEEEGMKLEEEEKESIEEVVTQADEGELLLVKKFCLLSIEL